MGKFSGLSRFKKIASTLGIAATSGAVISNFRAEPGLKGEGTKLGAIEGAAIGATILGAKPVAKALAKAAKSKGRIVFRRIRGRVVPIRVRK